MIDIENSFRTSRFHDAALLIACDLPLLNIVQPKMAKYFIFGERVKALEILKAYNAGNLQINARKFVASMNVVGKIILEDDQKCSLNN